MNAVRLLLEGHFRVLFPLDSETRLSGRVRTVESLSRTVALGREPAGNTWGDGRFYAKNAGCSAGSPDRTISPVAVGVKPIEPAHTGLTLFAERVDPRRGVGMRSVGFGSNSAQAVRNRPAVKPSSMIASFTDWLHDYIFYAGVVGIIESVLGILAFGGVLSVVFGSPTIKAAAVVAVLLGVIGLFVLLVANRTEWRRRSDRDRRLIRHYCDELKERYQHAWTVTSWTCVTTIAPNGDTSVVITCTAVVECDLLDFFSVWDGPNWDGWPERFRRRVRINVRRRSEDPNGGTRPDVTSSWLARNCVETLVHLGQPARRGETIGVVVELDWPARCLPFAKGESCEEFVQKFRTPVHYARNTIVLPKGYQACFETVGLVEGVDDFELTSEPNNNGQLETTLVTRNIEGGRRVGLRLDLR